jgi:hypothetical protein
LPVLGADTSVVIGEVVLGKPATAPESRRMLEQLSGREHRVLSAVTLHGPAGPQSRLSTTIVRFRRLDDDEIDAYWRSGEPRDKAGGYAVQGLAAGFVEHLAGSYSGVMGLPLFETAALLAEIRHPSARGDGLMSAEILINVGPGETRGAVLENGVLQEIFIERASRRGIVGNIYKGRVSRVLPGMQAAFVEVGLERTAFLHVDDIEPKAGEATAAAGASRDIRQLLSAGDDVIVQVAKDPLGGKGARLSTSISLPSRLLVYMPRGSGVGVSARIDDEAERSRLRDTILGIVKTGHSGGYIVRTAAVGATPAQLASDLEYLERLWAHVREGSARVSAGNLVHEDLPLATRLLRDELAADVRRVLIRIEPSTDAFREAARVRRASLDARGGRASGSNCTQGARPLFDLLWRRGRDRDRALERQGAI